MSKPRTWVIVTVLALGAGGCAGRTAANARRAFDSSRGRGGTTPRNQSEVVSGGGGGVFEREKVGWDRVAQMLDDAVSTMRASPDDAELARLATRWCAVEPEPVDTAEGPVRVCNPEPAVIVQGTSFSLEFGDAGVIGLVATDLSAEASVRLVKDAQAAAKPLCLAPWTEAPRTDAPAFHTCVAEGGPLLTIGRFRRDPASDRWLVTVAVLSPG